jgi:hypothetical protein
MSSSKLSDGHIGASSAALSALGMFEPAARLEPIVCLRAGYCTVACAVSEKHSKKYTCIDIALSV